MSARKYAHRAEKSAVTAARESGTTVKAECGRVVKPLPIDFLQGLPTCAKCAAVERANDRQIAQNLVQVWIDGVRISAP